MKRIKKTFREKIDSSYHKTVDKHRFLRIPAFLVLGLILMLHDLWFLFIGGWKRYACASFLLINILIGSSFAYPVFGEWEGFISGGDSSVLAEASTIELAQDNKIALEEINEIDEEYIDEDENENDHSDLENYDSYSLAEILAERDEILPDEDYLTEEVPQQETFSFSANDWRLILINKQHPIPDDYESILGAIKGDMKCDERIIDELLLMMRRAHDSGIELAIISPYRDMNRQELLFNRKIDTYMRAGLSYWEAYKRASQTVTVPGTSEHQIGLAIDITSSDYKALNAGFAETKAGRWLSEHCYDFGFILRYPLGKEYITGIEFEPWHFRYVGKEAARVIKDEQLTLEEFVEKYVR